MSLGQILSSDTGLTLVGAVVGSIWAAVQSSAWYQRVKNQRYCQALAALEAGVEVTYRTYVRAIKDSRADGRLTDDEMRQARDQALNAAVEFGRAQGLDILRELGPEYIVLLIAKLVKQQKAA